MKTYFGIFLLLIYTLISCQKDEDPIITLPGEDDIIRSESELASSILDAATTFSNCIDFFYPILFNVYRTEFQTLEVISVHNNSELIDIIEQRVNNSNYLVSLNYDVFLLLFNQSLEQTSNNADLLEVISEVSLQCSFPNFDCPDLQADIFDICVTPNEDIGEVSENCECIVSQE